MVEFQLCKAVDRRGSLLKRSLLLSRSFLIEPLALICELKYKPERGGVRGVEKRSGTNVRTPTQT